MGKKAVVFGIPPRDRADSKQQLEEWRAHRTGERDYDVKSDTSMIAVMVLFRPVGFDAGLCMRLARNPVRPYVWLITLVGYPAISGRENFSLRWTHNNGRFLDVEKVPTYASAGQFASMLPTEVKVLAKVHGGTMLVQHNNVEQEAQTGRWFVSFADLPEWTPSLRDLSDPRLQGRCEIHDLTPTGQIDRFRTLASISGPMPIHPGSMAMGWRNSDGLRLGPIEARIYQEYAGGATTANYAWRITPFTITQFEGELITVDIGVYASNQDLRDGDVELSVAIQLDLGDGMTLDDFEGELSDWVLAAISDRDEFSFSDGRLFVTINPDEEVKIIQMLIPTLADAIVEGNQLFTIRLNAARASTGVIVIEQSECNVTLADKDSAVVHLSGPSLSAAPGEEDYTISIDGLFQPGSIISVTIFAAGDTNEEDTSDWAESLAAVVATIDGASFDAISGRLTIIPTTQGGIAAISFTVGFFDSAAGKTFGLSLAEPDVTGGSAEIGFGDVLTQLKNAAVFSIAGDEFTTVPGIAEFNLTVAGVFHADDQLQVTIVPFGTTGDEDKEDWRNAIEYSIAGRSELSFSRTSRILQINVLDGGAIDPIPISINLFGSATGKIFGWVLGDPQLTNGDAILGQAEAQTELRG